MKKVLIVLGILISLAGFSYGAVIAEIPLKMHFSGSFSPSDTTVDFYITSQTVTTSRLPGNNTWHEQYSLTNGAIDCILGSQTPIPRPIFVGNSTVRYLEVRVGDNSTFTELVSVPFAYRASYANELTAGTTVQGGVNIKGNLGIGIYGGATEKLDIIGSNDSTLRLKNTSDTESILKMDSNRSNQNSPLGSICGFWNGTQVAAIKLLSGYNNSYKTDGEISFLTSNGTLSERMRINRDGKIGIGTYLPTELLTVNGNLLIGVSGNESLYVDNNGTVGIRTGDPSATLDVDGDVLINKSKDSYGNLQVKGTNDDNLLLVQAINNKVGIGLASPAAKLDVNGDIYSSNGSAHTKLGNGEVGTTTNNGLSFVVNNYPRVCVTTGESKVGIGTQNPDSALEIKRLGDDPSITLNYNDQFKYTLGLDGYNNRFKICAGNTISGNDFVISSGKVGIGTAVPNYKLDVNGIINATDIYKNGSPFTVGCLWNSATGGINYAGGNVGIGTTSPGAKLDIIGDNIKLTGTSTAEVRATNTNTNTTGVSRIVLESGSSEWRLNAYSQSFGSYESKFTLWGGNAGHLITATQNGKVGIGTTNPTERLEVYGSGTQRIQVASSNGLAGLILGSGSTSNTQLVMYRDSALKWLIVNDGSDSDKLKISDNDAVNITIDQSGRVGIGTTTPNEKLDVNGNAVVAGNLILTGVSNIFVSRGEVSAWDTDISGASDSNWHELNFSSIVQVGAKAVLLRVAIVSGAASNNFGFRAYGSNSSYNISEIYTQSTGYFETDIICPLGSNGKLEYNAHGVTWTHAFIYVKGWWK